MQRGKPKLRYSKLEFSGRERGRRAFVALVVVVVGGGVESITPSSRKEEEDLDTHTLTLFKDRAMRRKTGFIFFGAGESFSILYIFSILGKPFQKETRPKEG